MSDATERALLFLPLNPPPVPNHAHSAPASVQCCALPDEASFPPPSQLPSMRPTSAAQQLAAVRPDGVAAGLDQPGTWTAFTSAADATTAVEPATRRPLSLSRQPTPLLPCGLTAEELAALTASQAAAGSRMAGEGASSCLRQRDRSHRSPAARQWRAPSASRPPYILLTPDPVCLACSRRRKPQR